MGRAFGLLPYPKPHSSRRSAERAEPTRFTVLPAYRLLPYRLQTPGPQLSERGPKGWIGGELHGPIQGPEQLFLLAAGTIGVGELREGQ